MLVFLATAAHAGVISSLCDPTAPEGTSGACLCLQHSLRPAGVSTYWTSGIAADGSVDAGTCFDYGSFYGGVSDRVLGRYQEAGVSITPEGRRWIGSTVVGDSTVMLDTEGGSRTRPTWFPVPGLPDRWELIEPDTQTVRATVDSASSPPTGAFFFTEDQGGPEQLLLGLDDGRVLEIVDGLDPNVPVFIP